MTPVAVNHDRFVPFIRFDSLCESGLRVAARAINFECAGEGGREEGEIQRTDERIRRDGIIVPPSAFHLLSQNLNKYRLEVGRSSSHPPSTHPSPPASLRQTNEQTPATELFNYRQERYPIVVPRLSNLESNLSLFR